MFKIVWNKVSITFFSKKKFFWKKIFPKFFKKWFKILSNLLVVREKVVPLALYSIISKIPTLWNIQESRYNFLLFFRRIKGGGNGRFGRAPNLKISCVIAQSDQNGAPKAPKNLGV